MPEEADLAEVLATVSEGLEVDLLVILDQFEEYFLYHGEEEVDAEPFARELAAAVNRPGLAASFILSLRDDALARLDRFKARIPRLFSNYLRLRPLAGKAARSAIVEPVAVWNALPAARDGGPVRLEKELVTAVVDEVRRGRVRLDEGGRGGAAEAETGIEAPFLQLVMTRVWEEELGSGSRVLRARTLGDLGGAAAIVGGHLDRVMGELSAEERAPAVRRISSRWSASSSGPGRGQWPPCSRSRGSERSCRNRARRARRRATVKAKASAESGGPWCRQRDTRATSASCAASSAAVRSAARPRQKRRSRGARSLTVASRSIPG